VDPDGETITASNSFDHAKASNAKSKTSAVETSKRGATGGASGHHNSHSSQETAEKIGHAAGDAEDEKGTTASAGKSSGTSGKGGSAKDSAAGSVPDQSSGGTATHNGSSQSGEELSNASEKVPDQASGKHSDTAHVGSKTAHRSDNSVPDQGSGAEDSFTGRVKTSKQVEKSALDTDEVVDLEPDWEFGNADSSSSKSKEGSTAEPGAAAGSKTSKTAATIQVEDVEEDPDFEHDGSGGGSHESDNSGSRGSAKVQHPFAKAETKSGDVLDEEGEDQLDMGHSHKEGTSHSKSASISGGSEDEDLTAGETSMSKSGSKSSKHADTDSSETSAKTGGKSDGKYDIVAADEDFAEDTSTSKSGSKGGHQVSHSKIKGGKEQLDEFDDTDMDMDVKHSKGKDGKDQLNDYAHDDKGAAHGKGHSAKNQPDESGLIDLEPVHGKKKGGKDQLDAYDDGDAEPKHSMRKSDKEHLNDSKDTIAGEVKSAIEKDAKILKGATLQDEFKQSDSKGSSSKSDSKADSKSDNIVGELSTTLKELDAKIDSLPAGKEKAALERERGALVKIRADVEADLQGELPGRKADSTTLLAAEDPSNKGHASTKWGADENAHLQSDHLADDGAAHNTKADESDEELTDSATKHQAAGKSQTEGKGKAKGGSVDAVAPAPEDEGSAVPAPGPDSEGSGALTGGHGSKQTHDSKLKPDVTDEEEMTEEDPLKAAKGSKGKHTEKEPGTSAAHEPAQDASAPEPEERAGGAALEDAPAPAPALHKTGSMMGVDEQLAELDALSEGSVYPPKDKPEAASGKEKDAGGKNVGVGEGQNGATDDTVGQSGETAAGGDTEAELEGTEETEILPQQSMMSRVWGMLFGSGAGPRQTQSSTSRSHVSSSVLGLGVLGVLVAVGAVVAYNRLGGGPSRKGMPPPGAPAVAASTRYQKVGPGTAPGGAGGGAGAEEDWQEDFGWDGGEGGAVAPPPPTSPGKAAAGVSPLLVHKQPVQQPVSPPGARPARPVSPERVKAPRPAPKRGDNWDNSDW